MLSRISHIAISSLLSALLLTQPLFAATVTGVQTQTIANNDTIASGWFQQANDRLVPFSVSSGNVGIGTASPSVKLDINGQVKITGGTPWAGKVLTSDANGLASWQSVSNASPFGSSTAWWWWNGGFRLTTNAIDTGGGYFENQVDSTKPNWVLDVGWIWYTFWDGFRISRKIPWGSIFAYVDYFSISSLWNIGIGTATPWAKLDIAGSIKISDGTQGSGKVLTSDANGLASWQTVSGGGWSSAFPWTSTGSNSVIFTGSNVGIGTYNPSYKLHVNGVAYFWDPAATYNPSTYAQTYNYSINLGGFPISYTLYNSYDGGYWGNLFIGWAGMWSGQRTTMNGQFNQSVWGTALGQMGTWTSNNVFGWGSFKSMTTWWQNTAMGRDTWYNLTTGNNNSFFGAFAGRDLITGDNNIAVGYNAQLPSTSSSNQLSIGNWIYGNNGNVGIWTSTPWQKLSVAGTVESTSGGFKFPDGTTQTTASAWGWVPAGAIMAFNLATCPTGWIAANGTNGTPDLRWEFVRGLDNGRGLDTWRTLASWQVDMLWSHTHTFATQSWGWATVAPRWVSWNSSWTDGDLDGSVSVTWYDKASVTLALNNAGWAETRPRNVALLYCQKQ
jgi:hypothetical protein